MPTPVILNPAARSEGALRLADRLAALRPEPEIHLTRGPGDAERLARELAAAGHDLVVAAGGDGTVNEAVNGLAQHHLTVPDPARHAAMGVLPVGTMNVFAAELGLPRRLESCWQRIAGRSLREVDLWRAGQRFFVQLAGVGLDAEIVRQTSWHLKRRFGPLSYVLTGLRVLGRRPPLLTVRMEGRPDLHGAIVLVGSGRRYGGPLPVFRRARNDDGLLDLLVFRRQTGVEALQFLAAQVFAGYEWCGDLDYLQAREFRVESESDAALQLDGEFAGHAPVEFSPAPFRLRVAV